MNRRWIFSFCFLLLVGALNIFAAPGSTAEIALLRQVTKQSNPDIPFQVRQAPDGRITLLSGQFTRNIQGQFKTASYAFIENHKDLLGISDVTEEFQEKSIDRDIFGMQHLTLQQVYHGIPVLHRMLKIHTNVTGHLSGVTSTYFPGINISTTPSLSSQSVASALTASGENIIDHHSPELVIYIHRNSPTLAYSIDAELSADEAYQYIVDAQSGQIVQKYSLVQEGESVYGHGVNVLGETTDSLRIYQGTDFYRDNIQNVIDQWNNQYGYGNYTPTAGAYNLVDLSDTTLGAIYTLTSFDTTYYHVNFVQSATDTFASDSAQYSHQSGVSAHMYHRAVLDYYFSNFGRRSWDDAGERVVGIVDFGHNYFNAFYSGYTSTMNYGGAVDAGQVVFRPFSGSLDIVAHEYTHGITDNTSDLIYQNQSGALNEHFSDAFGYFIEAAEQNGGDWFIGEDLTDYPGYLGIRDMADPPAGGQPDRVGGQYYFPPTDDPNQQNDNGGVHTNSGIPNKVLYLLVDGGIHYGITVEPFEPDESDARQVASQLWYAWGTDYLTAADDFSIAYRKMLMACSAMYPGNLQYYQSIQKAWSSVGVHRDMYEHVSVNPGYLSPGSGAVDFRAVLKNIPETYEDFKVAINIDSVGIDTLLLYNDGQHNDGLAQDTIWAAEYPVDTLEATYQVDFLATDSISGFPDVYSDITRFTTIGPVQFHAITFSTDTLPQPGDNYYIQFSVKNNSNSATARRVTASISTIDSNLTVQNATSISYGDIPAGEIGTSSGSVFLLSINDNSPIDIDVPVLVTIRSDGYVFWTDTMYVHISAPTVDVAREQMGIPSEYALHENFPNPFNPTTAIRYDLPEKARVRLTVYDMLGRQVKALVNDEISAGFHTITWDGTNQQGIQAGTGVYLYRLETKNFHDSGKMILLK